MGLHTDDHAHIPSFSYAMARTARLIQGATPVPLSDLYGAAQRALRADGRATIPLSTFVRLLGALGVVLTRRTLSDGQRVRVAHGLVLRHG